MKTLGLKAILARGAVAALFAGAGAAPAAAADHAAAAAVPGPRERVAERGAAFASSFAELQGMVDDPNGPSAIELGARTYIGDLVIRRPVAVRGTKGTVIDGSGRGTVVTVTASDVVLEGLVVRSSGRRHTAEDAGMKLTGERITVRDVRVEETLFGISLQACKRCVVERAHVLGWGDDAELRGDGIKLWESNDSIVRGSRIERSRDVVVWYTKRATLEDNVVINGRYGAHFMYAHDSVVRRSRFEGDVVGIFVMYSMRLHVEDNILAGARGAAGVGLGFKDSDGVQVRRNWLVANTTGTYLDNTPRTPDDPVLFEGNLFALNDVAARFHGSERGLSFRGNDLHQNATLIEVDGRGDALSADVRGNRYSDYEGYDLDGDGVGDLPYRAESASEDLVAQRPELAFLRGAPALALVDVGSRLLPLWQARELLTDLRPRMSPRPLPALTTLARSTGHRAPEVTHED